MIDDLTVWVRREDTLGWRHWQWRVGWPLASRFQEVDRGRGRAWTRLGAKRLGKRYRRRYCGVGGDNWMRIDGPEEGTDG
jgi:hypothetical protein